jgi:hypothetical protein
MWPNHALLTATLGLAAASWVVAVRQMNGMDMGVATRLVRVLCRPVGAGVRPRGVRCADVASRSTPLGEVGVSRNYRFRATGTLSDRIGRDHPFGQ